MALVFADRVTDTSTTTGTTDFALSGTAPAGFQAWSVIGNTNTAYYTATDGSGNWETGIGTYSSTGPTLARTTVLASSNAGSKVSFPAGTKTVFNDPAAAYFIIYAAGIAAWLASPTSANLASAMTDETGSGALVFAASPALTGSPTAPTQTAGDNSTKLATTAYADDSAAAASGALTLLATLNTTSGTAVSYTGGFTGYRAIFIEINAVKQSANVALSVALSVNSGSSYGTGVALTAVAGSGGAASYLGAAWVYDIQFTPNNKAVAPSTITGGASFNTVGNGQASGTGVINAIQFSAGTFSSGSILVYGFK